MADAAVERGGEPLGGRRVAQAGDPERLAGGGALGAALVVAAGGVLVGGAGVERHEPPAAELERHRLDREVAEVDPQRAALLAAEDGELVEQPGLRADVVVLHARAELRELDAVDVGVLEQRQAQRGLQRGGGGEPGAVGEVALDRQPAGRHRVPGGAQLGDRAAHERAPALRGAVVAGERERVPLAQVRARAPRSGRRRAARP